MVPINLDSFFKEYIDHYNNQISRRRELNEILKSYSDNLKKYSEALTELEKKVNEVNLNLFDYEKAMIIETLKNFDLKNIDKSIKMIYNAIEYLNLHKFTYLNIADKYYKQKNFWNGFLSNHKKEDAIFAKDINSKIKKIEEDIKKVSIEDMLSLEETIDFTFVSIQKAVSSIQELKAILNSVFVEEEALKIYYELEAFFKDKYKTMSLKELLQYEEDIKYKISKIKKEWGFLKIPIYLVKSKKGGRAYSYAAKLAEDTFVSMTEVIIEDPVYKPLNQYIYIENSPNRGIFSTKEIVDNLDIYSNQIEAILTFKEVMENTFVFFVIFSLLIIIFNFVGFIGLIPMLGLLMSLGLGFFTLFRFFKNKIDEEYKVKNAFYFIEISFVFIKEGTNLFKYKDLKPLILKYFYKIYKSNLKGE